MTKLLFFHRNQKESSLLTLQEQNERILDTEQNCISTANISAKPGHKDFTSKIPHLQQLDQYISDAFFCFHSGKLI